MTIWLMREACWIPKATNTQAGCATLIPFPLQSVWMLRYNVHCLSCLYKAWWRVRFKRNNAVDFLVSKYTVVFDGQILTFKVSILRTSAMQLQTLGKCMENLWRICERKTPHRCCESEWTWCGTMLFVNICCKSQWRHKMAAHHS